MSWIIQALFVLASIFWVAFVPEKDGRRHSPTFVAAWGCCVTAIVVGFDLYLRSRH